MQQRLSPPTRKKMSEIEVSDAIITYFGIYQNFLFLPFTLQHHQYWVYLVTKKIRISIVIRNWNSNSLNFRFGSKKDLLKCCTSDYFQLWKCCDMKWYERVSFNKKIILHEMRMRHGEKKVPRWFQSKNALL